MLREHVRDFLAIIALTAFGIATAVVILSSQATALPSWVPFLGEDRFELTADFSTAQAVTPGQGQAVNIAGIQVGDITGVELVDGRARVKMEIDNEYAPPDQRGRDDAAAPEDRAQRHDDRGRSRHLGRERRRRGDAGSLAQRCRT